MTNRAAATRYARALLEVGEQEGTLEGLERELTSLVELFEAHPPLREALVHPSVPPAKKEAILTELMPRLGGVSNVTSRLLTVMADRDRLSILGDVLHVYHERLRELRGVVSARITTATPLPAERVQAIAGTLAGATGKRVELETRVDSTLLGGIVTQIGSTVYDGSIVQHLKRLRRRFLAQT